ncbi:hypothetical protein TRFO_36724 [Tritrichomonas foetus]|uniref:Uncharacterized protein n=1 Tax=Tritrichomonas foetus TaxID=1144522 RepID=A0A1J4JIU8_9EUKA|nr:hypothetical protein TRFO_36724 [Tritrichomonas foetus]|eukprot:OHS97140.1 hypothetical protein TRFO_36724 [Tritrichomonas foetus]
MRSALLQKLLNKQKSVKYGDFITNEQWPELHNNILTGQTKIDDILPPLIERDKLINFAQYSTTLEPNPSNLKILSQILPKLPETQLPVLLPNFRNLVLGYTQYQSQVIDLLVRSLFIIDTSAIVDVLISIVQAIPTIHSAVSSSLTKFFPQTNFPQDQQIRYLRACLTLCSVSSDIAVNTLGRIFQHLVALDCELLLDPSNDGSVQVDDDVAQCLTPQLTYFLNYVSQTNSTIFTLLLQLFDLYLIDLPHVVAVQFIYFFSSSFDHSTAETFVGFLLAKIIDDSASLRTRSNATLYLESLVVHAEYIDDEFAAAIVDYVANFANCYALHIKNEAPERLKMDIKIHNLYYFAVQCVTYITCWRWKGWSQSNIDPIQRWHLDDLLTNPLRAIDVIDKNTADMFKSLNIFQINDESIVIERISVWFPFDPCPLDEIAQIVANTYTQWSEVEGNNDIDALLDSELSRLCESRLISIDPIISTQNSQNI